MALPTPEKTWQFSTIAANTSLPAQGNVSLTNKNILLNIVNALRTFPLMPWVVQRSSNAVVANTSNNWATVADIVGAAGNHSWIVLQQSGINGAFQVCIDCNNAAANFTAITVVVSKGAGFTGGTIGARPTATDEQVVLNSAAWTDISTDIASRLTVMQSEDGECTRIYVAASGTSRVFAMFDKPGDPVTGWTNPYLAMWVTVPSFANLFQTGFAGKIRNGSTNGNATFLSEGYSSAVATQDIVFGNIPNEISNEWPMYPIGFASNTVGLRGRHGRIVDLWTGSNAIATGDSYPADGSNQFAQFNTIILPWNGGPVNLS